MADYGMWQGAERATGRMATTGMQLLQFKGQQQHQQALEADSARRLKIAEDQAAIQTASGNLALKQAQEAEAALNQPINLKAHPNYLAQSEKAREKVLKFFIDNGYTDPSGVGTVRSIKQGGQVFESTKSVWADATKSTINEKELEVNTAWDSLKKAKLTGDQAKIAKAQSEYDIISGEYSALSGGFATRMKQFEEQEGKIELERIKQEGKGDKERADEWKIKELMAQNPGLTSQEATGIILGTIKVLQDPVSGTRNLVDTVKGTERPLVEAGGMPSTGKKSAPPTKSIWELSSKSTGPISAAKAAGSVVTGTIGLPVAEETLYARQFVQGAQNDLIRSLSINPRFPVGEINRLKEEVNLAPTIFDNPKMMRQRILAINDYLSKRVKNEMGAAKDTSLGVEARKNARSAANDIENFLDILGAPQIITTKEEYDALPKGAIYITEDGTEKKKGGK